MASSTNRKSIIFGTLLLAAGILALVGQIFTPVGGFLWPVIITGLGLAFFVGMLIGGRSFGVLAIPGSIITGIGLILLVQSVFGLWNTWSYTWTLVISLVGIGLVIYGSWSQIPDLRRSGWHIARLGLTLFVIFGLLLEFVFAVGGLSGRTGHLFWPVLLILIGFAMIFSRSYRLIRNREEDRRADLNLFWPVIFIGAGLIWLMITQNMLAVSDLNVIINLWPVLLIAAGVNLLLSRRFQWVNLLLGIVVVAGTFYVIYNHEQLGLTPRTPWSVIGVNISDSQPVDQWVTGSDDIAEETRPIGAFNRISLRSTGELILRQGDQPALTIAAEENLLPYLITEVNNGQLVIRTLPGVGLSTNRPIRYYLTVTDLTAISLSGAGSIHSESLPVQDLDITLSGLGSLNLAGLQAESLDINISGSGSANVSGTAEQLTVNISGAGGFDGADLETSTAKVEISGAGRAIVWANDRLQTSITGLGSISYYGSPQVSQNTSGVGTVRKLGDK